MDQANNKEIANNEANEISYIDLSELTDRGILRFQLEQLAEVSKDCLPEELPDITSAMIDIVAYLENNREYNKA